MPIRIATVLVVLCGAPGCVYKYNFTQTRTASTPREATCKIEMLNVPPAEPFTELGVFEPRADPTTQMSEFMAQIAPPACAAGADAVIAQINGLGGYIRGVAIKYSEKPKL